MILIHIIEALAMALVTALVPISGTDTTAVPIGGDIGPTGGIKFSCSWQSSECVPRWLGQPRIRGGEKDTFLGSLGAPPGLQPMFLFLTKLLFQECGSGINQA